MVNICNPLLFFIILVSVWLIVILFSNNVVNKGQMIIQTLIWTVILGVFIYYFCSIGKYGWAWFVVFLPLLLSILLMLLFVFGFSIGMGMEAGKNYQDLMNYYFYKK